MCKLLFQVEVYSSLFNYESITMRRAPSLNLHANDTPGEIFALGEAYSDVPPRERQIQKAGPDILGGHHLRLE